MKLGRNFGGTYRSLVVSDDKRSTENFGIGNPFLLSFNLLRMTVFTTEVRTLQKVAVALDAAIGDLK